MRCKASFRAGLCVQEHRIATLAVQQLPCMRGMAGGGLQRLACSPSCMLQGHPVHPTHLQRLQTHAIIGQSHLQDRKQMVRRSCIDVAGRRSLTCSCKRQATLLPAPVPSAAAHHAVLSQLA